MTISKLTNNVQPLDEVDKINELVDGVNGSQPLLVSGTNIKTINNNSILGSGNIEIQSGSSRNIGEIVSSTIPLTDAGLHLLDGALISGSGIYSDFVDYIAGLYADDPTASYFAQPTTESEVSWTQPTLTANGTMGGDEFACSASSYPNVYRAFNSTNTQNVYSSNSSETIIFYNPNKLKVTSIVWNVYDGNRNPLNYTVQGSNDGSTYTSIITNQTASAGASTTMDLSSNTDFYNYYKIIVNSFNTGQGNLKTLVISATQLISENKTAEQVWQEQVATYGVCGKFVYDSVNNTVRLPKYSNKIYTKDISSTTPVIGNGKSLGFYDGTSTKGMYGFYGQTVIGFPFVGSDVGDVGASSTYSYFGNGKYIGVSIDPSKSGLIAQLSNITTSLEGYYYIVVATSTKTDIQVDIDEIATDLNGKADVDLTNLSNGLSNTICTTAATTTSSATSAKPAVIVQNYINGTSWYRVYSDGWCEQGGIYNTGGAGNFTIYFSKTFVDTNYTVLTTTYRGDVNQAAVAYPYLANKATSSMVIGCGPATAGFNWQASGYIN